VTPITEGAIVKHTLYLNDRKFTGTVEAIDKRFGALVFWEHTKRVVRHSLHHLVCIEDADLLAETKLKNTKAEDTDSEIDESGDCEDVGDPAELSLNSERGEEFEDEAQEVVEETVEAIEESKFSDPLPSDQEDVEELVEEEP